MEIPIKRHVISVFDCIAIPKQTARLSGWMA